MARAWGAPGVTEVDLAERLWLVARDMWERAKEPRTVLLDALGRQVPKQLGELLDEAWLAEVREAVDGRTWEQWAKASVPEEVRRLAREGFEDARKRVAREFVQSQFPGALKERVAFQIVRRGPALVERLLASPTAPASLQAIRAVAGLTFDPAVAMSRVRGFDFDRRHRAAAEQAYSTPSTWERIAYVAFSPVRGLTAGLLDPVDLRGRLGIGGATPEDFRREVAGSWGTGFLVWAGELAGGLVGLGKVTRGLRALGLGRAAPLAAGVLTTSIQPDTREALRRGALAEVVLRVSAGALSSTVAGPLGRYVASLTPLKANPASCTSLTRPTKFQNR